MKFVKMHANGDHFVIVDSRNTLPRMTNELARRLGDPHRGIGFNQICEMTDSETAARLTFWNPDGSTLDACGSATRGVVSYLLTGAEAGELELETAMGVLRCRKDAGDEITVDMGKPILSWADIPLAEETDTLSLSLEGNPAACSMGNPHCTFFVNDVDAIDLHSFGPRVEHDALFPERINVHVVQVMDRTNLRLRIWERGGGIPEGSGSCSCGALVNAHRRGLVDDTVTVHCDGGPVKVAWNGKDGVFLTGRVEPIYTGCLDIS